MGFLRGRPGLRRFMMVFGGILGIFALGAGIFFLRSPVILVSDAPFVGLYGPARTRWKGLELSLRLFRPVRAVIIGEDTGPDIVAFVVEEKAKKPHAVLFPYRYYEGARRYGEKFPGRSVLVLGGRSFGNSSPEGPVFIGTDRETDCYRAGMAAALFAGEKPGKVLFFQDGTLSPADREAFNAGLREGGREEAPLFLGLNADYTAWQDVACVLMIGQATAPLDRNLSVPVILFSWIEPSLTPQEVKVVFDDSPWALAVQALGAVEGDQAVSNLEILADRIGDPEVVRSLKKIEKKRLVKK